MPDWPTYCGWRACTALATHVVTGKTRAHTTCRADLEAVRTWAGPDADVQDVTQPDDAVQADGQQELF